MTARGGPMGKPGGEVVRWKRSDVGVSYDIAGYLLKVTLVANGEVYECTVVKHDLTESFLRLLSDPEKRARSSLTGLGCAMAFVSRGFRGRPRRDVDATRVPPGQYVVDDFPVLSAGPTPRTETADWSFRIDGEVDEPLTLDVGRADGAAAGDVHRRHPLRDEVDEARHDVDGRLDRHAARRRRHRGRAHRRLVRRRLHDERPARGRDRRPRLAGAHLRRASRWPPSTADRRACSSRTCTSGRARSGCAA